MSKLLDQSLDSESTVVICAPSTHLYALSQISKADNIHLGAQNIYPKKSGAYTGEVSSGQLKESFKDFSADEIAKVVIAYEPIWAIGTGETASPEQAQEMHLAIRDFLKSTYGSDVSDVIPILYGGSVKPANAQEIFGQADVDGGLVGGASLNAESFAAIVNSFS
ncbi:UNVERIFIED_CONTAM: hypothetical protein GTU68_026973 [Idotea baltica]|nr:hypothetical protein [Idotea baltica]